MVTESHMAGAHDEPVRNNEAVHAKGDLHGMGRRAPHLTHPGETAPITGTHVAGHTENGHKLPVDVSPTHGAHKVEHYTPGEMGAPMIRGEGMGRPKNVHLTDALPKHSTAVGMPRMATHEPDPVRAGHIANPARGGLGTAHGKGSDSTKGSQERTHQDNGRSMQTARHGSSRSPHAKLDGSRKL